METRASHLLVGAFVLALSAALFVFVVWLGKLQLEGTSQRYFIYFTGPVTGLQVGSPVLYRGVAVGNVTDIRIDPDNVERVRVAVELDADTPIKTDSVAMVEMQGVTGTAVVQIVGGSRDAPRLTAVAEDVPVIPSVPSRLETVFETAPELLQQLVGISAQLAELLGPQNQKAIGGILANVETLTGSLAAAAAQSDDTVGEVRQAVRSLEALTTELRSTVQTLSASADAAITEMRGTLQAVGADTRALSQEAVGTAAEFRAMAVAFQQAAGQLNALLEENREPLQDFTASGLYQVTGLIAELRELTVSLTRLITRIERSPTEFLFGGSGRGVEVP